MFYRFVANLFRVLMKLMFGLKVNNRNLVPKEGPFIVALNHGSNWDVPMIAAASPRDLTFMAKAELFEKKLLNALFTALGAFPVHRGTGDIGAIKTALKALSLGRVLMIFPQGHRSTKERLRGKPGAVMIATRAKVPIVPANISGKYRLFSRMTVTFGEPIYYDEYYGKKLSMDDLQGLTDELMAKIYELSC